MAVQRAWISFLFTVLVCVPLLASAGDREERIMIKCAALTGGDATLFATCVKAELTRQEISNVLDGKFMGCNNEIRRLFRAFDSGCRGGPPPPPELVFTMPYRSGFIAGYESGGHSLYLSPDGDNLRGGGNTELVYSAGQKVRAIAPFRGGVMTAFTQGGIYYSPDGRNLGGGGDTERRYKGYPVSSMRVVDGALETCFSGAGCYCSSDGRNPGGGPGTRNGRC